MEINTPMLNNLQMWISGLYMKSGKIKNNKVILKISEGEGIRLHRYEIKSKKLKIKPDNIEDVVFLKQNIIIYVSGDGNILCTAKAICDKGVMILYVVTITIVNGNVKSFDTLDCRGVEYKSQSNEIKRTN